MILTDGQHLVSTVSIAGLHRFAQRIGLNRYRYHGGRSGRHPHYDLPKSMVNEAIRAGAEQVTSKEVAQRGCWGRGR